MTKPITPSDADLLRSSMTGDEQAFAALYRRHQGAIYRFALLMSGKATVAEEVTQEVFLALLRKENRYDPARGSLSAYLCGAARNQVLRLLERDRPLVQLVEGPEEGDAIPLTRLISGDDPLDACVRKQAIKLTRQAVLALPARYRETIVLCDFLELTCAEAAQALGCPVGTVNSRLSRGRVLLLKKMRAAARLDSAAPDAQGMRCFA
jgi:RNA polymerase sigma-70 factor (ECF subfamily)